MHGNVGELLEWIKTGTGDTLLSPASVEARHSTILRWLCGAVNYGVAQFTVTCSLLLFLVEGNWYRDSGGTLGCYTDCYRNDDFGGISFDSCRGDLGHQFLRMYERELASRGGDVSPTTTPLTAIPEPTAMSASLAPVSFLALWPCILVGLVTLAV